MNKMRRHQSLLVLTLLVIGCMFGQKSMAATVVAPSVFAATEAPEQTAGVFRGGGLGITFQWILPASDFSTVPLGSPITAIGFRQDAAFPDQGQSASFALWNLQLSGSNNPSLTLSPAFAENIGADVVTVRSGPLLIPANSFPGGATPNQFYDIPFATPYIYNGGEVVVTLRHTAHSGPISLIFNDADDVAFARGNSVSEGGFAAATGLPNFFNFPVTRFSYVPEPGVQVLALIALLTTAARLRPALKTSRPLLPRSMSDVKESK